MIVELPAIARAWGWEHAEIAPLSGGLINATYAVRERGAPIAVLQRIHPIFDGTVNLDLEAVTAHLAAKGLVTPRLLRTVAGEPWIVVDGRVWRALTWVDGVTIHRVPDPRWAAAGGELLGTFHRAVADLRHTYAFTRAGVHDTAAHLARLAQHVAASSAGAASGEAAWIDEAIALGREIADVAGALPPLPVTPLRHCHGDLKISNLLFAEEPGHGVRGVCLIDLDTLARGTMAFELGDAMRSWCNPSGEDTGNISFDLPIFAAAVGGFRAIADDLLSPDERTSIVIGTETVCVELAARFAVDVFRDEYFGWDAGRFPSRRAHNLVRARGQLALARAVRAARDAALDVVHGGG